MAELEGKKIIVTGAARGIGRAIALACVRQGATVGLNYKSSEEAARKITRSRRRRRSAGEHCPALAERIGHALLSARFSPLVDSGSPRATPLGSLSGLTSRPSAAVEG